SQIALSLTKFVEKNNTLSISKYLTPLTFLNMFNRSSYLKNLSNY
ncbi:Os12g0126600, partial [Oryza sativa Japonica Group]